MNSLLIKSPTPKSLICNFLLVILLPFSALGNTDITGTIWIDNDQNNAYNGEAGVNGVTVELVDFNSSIVIASTVSSGGNYLFTNQIPGEYMLRIPSSEFLTLATLNGLNSCSGISPSDDMIDDDDNGSDTDPFDIRTTPFKLTDSDPANNVKIEYIDFCFVVNDCTVINPLANMSCDQVSTSEIICDINILGSFCNTMPTTISGGNQPSPLCAGATDPAHNISWFGFVAFGGNYNISINPTGCTGEGGIGIAGIQVGLYSDCSFSESIFCSEACSLSPIDIPSSDLIEGQVYYLFIDGCGGDVCTYEIDIIGIPILPNMEPENVCVNNNGIVECDSTDYCIGGDIFIEATGLGIDGNFNWTITTIAGGPYSGNTSPTTENENLQIEFANEGRYEVCINSVNNGCQSWTGNKCTIVKITNTIPFVGNEMFDDQFVCIGDENNFDISNISTFDPNGDGTSGWQGSLNDIGIGTNTTNILTPGCSYNQSFELDTYDEEPPVDVYLAICGQDLPMQIEDLTITQASFSNSDIITFDSVLSLTPNENGCDSIINFTIEKLDIVDGFVNPPECTFNSIILDFDYNSAESTGIIFLNFAWKDPFGNVIFDPQGNNDPTDIEIPAGNPSGTYTLNIMITKNGFSCEYIYPVMVDFANIQPPTPTVSGITMVCSGANSQATYTAMGGDPSLDYVWSVPSDAIIVETNGPFGNMLTVDWENSNGGLITLQSENQCGFSETASLTVSVIPTTLPNFSIDTEACIGGETTVMSTGNGGNIISYIWDFDGAQVISGGSFNLGPNVLSWNTSGTKSISLQTTNTSGCLSDAITKNIEVIEPLVPTTIICQTTINDILFVWEEEPGVTYDVEIFTGQTGVFEGNNSYRVSGLNGGDIVTLELSQTQTNGICEDPVSTMISCEAQDCPFISILLSSNQNTFCENTPGQTQINAVVTSQVNGSGTFSGPGIVNPNGLFDPLTAEVGVNTITYSYIDENGCSEIETIDLTVLNAPTADITTNNATICIGGFVTLNYNGSQDVDSYNWQNSELTIDGVPNPTLTFQTVGVKTIFLTVTKDGCVSEQASIDIEVLASPVASFTLSSDTICLSEEVQLQYTGSGGVNNYAWNVGVGNVDNVPNPSVSFIFPGEKTIELIVSNGECISEVFRKTLIVEAPLSPLNIACSPSNGVIQFSWNNVEGASIYLISVNGNTPISTTNTIFNVNNLGSEELVEIIIEAVSDGNCPNVTASLSCTTLINSIADNDIIPIKLYPNPAGNLLFLENVLKNDRFSIFDLNGRQQLKGIFSKSIDVTDLITGLYFIKLEDEKGGNVQVLKFVKK